MLEVVTQKSYNTFKYEVEILLSQLYGLDINDVDIESLIRAHQSGVTSNEYVQELEDKLDLTKIDIRMFSHI